MTQPAGRRHKPPEAPFRAEARRAILRGDPPRAGAAARLGPTVRALMQRRGRTVLRADLEEAHARADHPEVGSDEHCVMVLRVGAPHGEPRMAEGGNIPLPQKVRQQEITDMVRISDEPAPPLASGDRQLGTAHVLQSGEGGHRDVRVGSVRACKLRGIHRPGRPK